MKVEVRVEVGVVEVRKHLSFLLSLLVLGLLVKSLMIQVRA